MTLVVFFLLNCLFRNLFLQVLNLLLISGANPNVKIQILENASPLAVAARAGFEVLIEAYKRLMSRAFIEIESACLVDVVILVYKDFCKFLSKIAK